MHFVLLNGLEITGSIMARRFMGLPAISVKHNVTQEQVNSKMALFSD